MNTQSQKNVFLQEEGDRWHTRNNISNDKLEFKRNNDPIWLEIQKCAPQWAPSKILEIGANNGWRLHLLQEIWPTCTMIGIDPSEAAITNGYDGINLQQGTADMLDFQNEEFDIVIFGFCLYLCDRSDLFQIAAEADRVLKNNGHLIIYDFFSAEPYKNPYSHIEGLYSYKMDNSKLFTWNPSYQVVKSIQQPHPGYEAVSYTHLTLPTTVIV